VTTGVFISLIGVPQVNTSITCTTTAVAIIITFKQVEGAECKLFIYSTNTRDLNEEQVVAKHTLVENEANILGH
jgi:hypothetical protein